MADGLALRRTGRGGWTPPARAAFAPSSRRLMRLAVLVLGPALAIALALLIVPAIMNWSRYRGAIGRYASAELGRPVRIDGAVTVALLPSPVMTATGVRLGDRGDGISMTAPALRLRLRLGALLVGRVAPRQLVLRGATIRLPWPLPPRALTGRRPDWLVGSSARIVHGTLRIGALTLTDLDASIVSGSADETPQDGVEQGGFVVVGAALGFGQRWSFTDHLGGPDAAGAAPVELTLSGQAPHAAGPDVGTRFIGTLSQDGGVSGRVTAQVADLSRLMPAPPVRAGADGTLRLGGGPAQADLALTIGGVPVAAGLRPATTAGTQVVTLRAGRLDGDAWVEALARSRAGVAPQRLALPWPVRLDLAADAVQLRGGLVRGLHAALDVDGDRATLHTATALLPGDAALGLAGALTGEIGGLHLLGDATLDAPRLRETLAWLQACGLRLGNPPPDVLRAARLTGRVDARRDRIAVGALSGTVDQSMVGGGIAVDTASGAIDAALTLDELAADQWWPGPPHWAALSGGLADADIALKLHVGRVLLRGVVVNDVVMDAASSAGGVAVNTLGFRIAGLAATAAGTIAANGSVADAHLDLAGASAAGLQDPIRRALPRMPIAPYLWSGPIHLHADAAGTLGALVIAAALDFADARLEAHPVIDLQTGGWTAEATLRHPGAGRLLGAFGLPKAPDWIGEGSLSVLARASSQPGMLRVDNFDLTAGMLHATGDGQRVAGAVPLVTGHLAADTLPLPGFAPHATEPMSFTLLHGWTGHLALRAAHVTVGDSEIAQAVQAQLDVQDGVARLHGLRAALGGGTLGGAATLDATAVPAKLLVDATLSDATLADGLFATPVDLQSGRFSAAFAGTAMGNSPAALLASLAGTLTLVGTAGSITGIDAAAAVRGAVPAGTPDAPSPASAATSAVPTPFSRLDAALHVDAGVTTIDRAVAQTPAGPVRIGGSLDLVAGSLTMLAHLPGPLDLRWSGPAAAPRAMVEPMPQIDRRSPEPLPRRARSRPRPHR